MYKIYKIKYVNIITNAMFCFLDINKIINQYDGMTGVLTMIPMDFESIIECFQKMYQLKNQNSVA